MTHKKKLDQEEKSILLDKLKIRFESHMHRHPNMKWEEVKKRIEQNPEKQLSLFKMESTGGEPDVVDQDENTGEYLFYDCSKESPKGRRSICYDKKAQEGRKKYPPKNNAEDLANEIGIELLSESEYKYLQEIENVDTKTSSWIKTPEKIRKLGGAIFADFRFDTVFVYHNGADSYYGSRGFRGCLKV